jgi:DNA-binding GntR family transcriptional regulator
MGIMSADGHGETVARAVRRSVLADEVYEILRESLRTGRMAPGDRLNLDRLARDLHVSNTPVRQALARLESDGLVTKEPYRGFHVSPLLDSRTVAELYDFRLMIEPPSAARAAGRGRPEAVRALAALCDAAEIEVLLAAADVDAMAVRDADFHTAIAREAGNALVVEHLTDALTRMSLYTTYHQRGDGELAWDEHRAVLAAIREGDPDGAAAAMRAHLDSGLRRAHGAVS